MQLERRVKRRDISVVAAAPYLPPRVEIRTAATTAKKFAFIGDCARIIWYLRILVSQRSRNIFIAGARLLPSSLGAFVSPFSSFLFLSSLGLFHSPRLSLHLLLILRLVLLALRSEEEAADNVGARERKNSGRMGRRATGLEEPGGTGTMLGSKILARLAGATNDFFIGRFRFDGDRRQRGRLLLLLLLLLLPLLLLLLLLLRLG